MLAESSPAWQIEALKFDRRLHISLPAHLLDDDGARLWFRTRAGDQINHITLGQQFPITQPSDLVFWRDRWYNVYLNYGDDGRLSHFYCNVGLPPEVSGQTLRFVDLDLDVRIGLDGQYRLLDADEFAEHTTLFGYPPEVQQAARRAVDDILAHWRARRAPFDGRRPG